MSVSPGRLQPGPMSTVGAGVAAEAPATGNQCARILVPSKEVTVQSLVLPDTAVAAGTDDGGAQAVVVEPEVEVAVEDVVVGLAPALPLALEQAPTTSRASARPTAARARRAAVSRGWSMSSPFAGAGSRGRPVCRGAPAARPLSGRS